MWICNNRGEKEFKAGKCNNALAEQAAKNCSHFQIDDEDELVSEETVTCYNCRYRRWNLDSFTCMKP